MGPFAMSDLTGLDIGWDEDLSTGIPYAISYVKVEGLGKKLVKVFIFMMKKK